MSEVNNTLQQNTIIFRMGEETGIVIEKENFSESLFREHYVKALQLANDIIGRPEQDANSNVIAFCADRGEGKTSCMQTVADLLTIKERYDKFTEEIPEANNFTNINPKDLHRLAIIDPAFFDEKHNIIELITGMMYESMQQSNEDCKKHTVSETTKLVSKFRDVQKSLEYIEKASSTEAPIYDALEKVQTLSQGLILPKKIEELMGLYLEYIGKKRLVICIDDIDLNFLYANRMIEQIRKYLSNPQCIILFATNIEQLTMVIRHSMEKDLYGRIIEGEEQTCQEMAAKYLTKLLPTSQRINLVHIAELYDKPLILQDAEGKTMRKWAKVKEAITQLIYAKTRYLFYNNESKTSPIVPTNLRSFRHLMRLLTSMDDFRNIRIRESVSAPSDEDKREYNKKNSNKDIFKNYFFIDWVSNNLSSRDVEFATTLVGYTDVAGINLLVIQYLSDRFNISAISWKKSDANKNEDKGNQQSGKKNVKLQQEIAGGYLDDDELEEMEEEKIELEIPLTIQNIVSKQNRTYNTTLGDVFYILSYLEKGLTTTAESMLLFFIKSFYSMRLYEYYDQITEKQGTLYPHKEEDDNRVNLYRVDDTYEHTNILQRFVNGSFFTYLPNEFMAFNRAKGMPRDLRVIDARAVRKFYKDVIQNFPIESKNVTSIDELKFQLCEFLCWTISRTAYASKNTSEINPIELKREQSAPVFLGNYSPYASLYVFDLMAPFYNVTNLQYAYSRWGTIQEKDFYIMAMQFKNSLLNIAINGIPQEDLSNQKEETPTKDEEGNNSNQTITGNPTESINFSYDYFDMLSSAIIRNGDVLISLRDHIVSYKNKSRGSSDTIQLFASFYKDIISSQMFTYHTRSDESDKYQITFSFLDAVVYFLNKLNSEEKAKEDTKEELERVKKINEEKKALRDGLSDIFYNPRNKKQDK